MGSEISSAARSLAQLDHVLDLGAATYKDSIDAAHNAEEVVQQRMHDSEAAKQEMMTAKERTRVAKLDAADAREFAKTSLVMLRQFKIKYKKAKLDLDRAQQFFDERKNQFDDEVAAVRGRLQRQEQQLSDELQQESAVALALARASAIAESDEMLAKQDARRAEEVVKSTQAQVDKESKFEHEAMARE